MKKLAIFDLDGTLLNSLRDFAECCNAALATEGLPPHPEDNYRFYVGNGADALLQQTIPQDAQGTAIARRVRERYLKAYRHRSVTQATFYDGALEMLRKLKAQGIVTAVVTNKPDEITQPLVQRFLSGLIDYAYGRSDALPPKPDPTMVRMVMRQAGVSEQDTIFAGDSDVDIFTGQAADIDTVGVLWGFRPREELEEAGAKLLAGDMEELYRYITAPAL